MNNITNAMHMLFYSNYKKVGIILDNKGQAKSLVVCDLMDDNIMFNYLASRAKITIGETDFYFFDKTEPTKLRGPNFDAVIIKGEVEKEYLDTLRFCLRLGDNPIRIHV